MWREEPNEIGAKASARKIIKYFGITTPEHICVEDIAMALGVYVHEAPLKGAEARLTRKGKKGIIRLKEDISFHKKRFAVSHELGHWERHAGISQLFYCTSEDLNGYNNSIPEVEANAFAGELLIPSILVGDEIHRNDPDINIIRGLSDTFDTSLMVAAIRFTELCPENCIVVFSENGQIKWWHKKKDCFLWIDTKIPVSRGSIAWDCFNGSNATDAMQEVEQDAWLPPNCRRRDHTLYEQSLKLGDYPTVLSLLWYSED